VVGHLSLEKGKIMFLWWTSEWKTFISVRLNPEPYRAGFITASRLVQSSDLTEVDN
jgi:hypothetical protein